MFTIESETKSWSVRTLTLLPSLLPHITNLLRQRCERYLPIYAFLSEFCTKLNQTALFSSFLWLKLVHCITNIDNTDVRFVHVSKFTAWFTSFMCFLGERAVRHLFAFSVHTTFIRNIFLYVVAWKCFGRFDLTLHNYQDKSWNAEVARPFDKKTHNTP